MIDSSCIIYEVMLIIVVLVGGRGKGKERPTNGTSENAIEREKFKRRSGCHYGLLDNQYKRVICNDQEELGDSFLSAL